MNSGFGKWPPDEELPPPPKEPGDEDMEKHIRGNFHELMRKIMDSDFEYTYQLRWELLEADPRGYEAPDFERAKVPGGWLVRQVGEGTETFFIKDPSSQWKLPSYEDIKDIVDDGSDDDDDDSILPKEYNGEDDGEED